MPIIFVDETILNQKHDCVVCPIKPSQYLLFEGVCGLIYNKAGKKELYDEFSQILDIKLITPYTTNGKSLSKEIIHIIGADMVRSFDFKKDLYISYDKIIKLITNAKHESVVFPPIPFSYKRLGDMHSYRAFITLINHFIHTYDIIDTYFYVLIKRITIHDHLNNYVSKYISTSKNSRRHKPIEYPFKSDDELYEFLKSYNIQSNKSSLQKTNDNLIIKNTTLKNLCLLIKDKFNDDRIFCIKSNISKHSLIKLFKGDYIPSKDEMIGICMALNLELIETYYYLDLINEKLDYDDERDCYIISAIATHKYDVLSLNERLFVKGLKQIGSNSIPQQFVINS